MNVRTRSAVRPVVVDGSQSGAGAVTGGVLGGIAGSSVGGRRESVAVGVIGFAGMFALYTYIAPLLTEVAGLEERWVPAVLALYGVGMVIGTLVSGAM